MFSDKSPFWKSPIFWGIVATVSVAVFGWLTFKLPACGVDLANGTACPSKWFYLSRATPNEIGDTLAGFAGALAFIWIIVTVAMQSQELSAQREELELTRREFERMADAQSEQVSLLIKQGQIFEREQQIRDQEFAISQIEQLQRRARETAGVLCVQPFTVHFLKGGGDATIDVKENRSSRNLDGKHANFAAWVYFDELFDAFRRVDISPTSLNLEQSEPALSRLITALNAIRVQLPHAGDAMRGELEEDGYLRMLEFLTSDEART